MKTIDKIYYIVGKLVLNGLELLALVAVCMFIEYVAFFC